MTSRVIESPKWRLAMRKLSKSLRRIQKRHNPDDHHRDGIVATVWLVFYVLAVGVAISSPIVSHALEIAFR
jgi:hypothetical protein